MTDILLALIFVTLVGILHRLGDAARDIRDALLEIKCILNEEDPNAH